MTLASGDPVDQDNLSLEESRNFVTAAKDSTSAAQMSVAQVPDDFDCPTFSNSPYKDILTAIDGLQTSINLFPRCDQSDKSTDVLTTMSTELRKNILEARSLEDKGETKKLGISAEQILKSATRLQDVISSASNALDCYKSDESKKLIFSINDTFQSIAPLALDFVAKNPALSATLSPYLPAVAGAQAISKGLSVLEFALKYVPTLNMAIPENRLAVIKNTCSFMKVYAKVEFLTLDRASRLKKINQQFGAEIQASLAKKKNILASLSASGLTLSSNPTDAAIIKIKDNSERYQKFLTKATDELTTSSGQASDISTCSVVKTVYSMKISGNILIDLNKLADLLQKTDQVAFKKTKLEEFNHEMNNPDVFKTSQRCASLGQDWLQSQKEALLEIKSILADYDSSSEETSAVTVAKIKVSREDKKTADLQADRQKLTLFADLSVFEPGELAKRMRGMPKYLFNGPNGSWYAKLKKNGPVFDLLQNNEESFKLALKKFNEQVTFLKNFETQFFLNEAIYLNPNFPSPSSKSKEILNSYIQNFTHLSEKYAPVGSYDHRELCNHAKLAIKSYVELTDHLISSEYLCKMIGPVLKESEVSDGLKRYCQRSKSLYLNTDLIPGYKEIARPLFVENGPKDQIRAILEKYDKLKSNCQ